MTSVNHQIKKIVKNNPLLQEGLARNILNFANTAEMLQFEIEKELGKEINLAAIIMALRRTGEELKLKSSIKFAYNSEIVMKSGLADLTYLKSPSLISKLKRVYELVDQHKGETLNIIQGNYEVTIVVSEKRVGQIKELLKEEELLNVEKELVSLAMSFSKDFLYTPGVLNKAIQQLFWEHINVFENISTMTEMIFIVSKKDALKAYNALQQLVESQNKQ